jgi:hypothetical protein
MRSKLKFLTATAVLAVATVTAPGIPASAAPGDWGYVTYAGGTQITAVGTTVTSDLTAESSVAGNRPNAATNKVASVRVGGLAQVGAVNTDATAVQFGDGFKTTAHARTANISLLNGAIRVNAIETTTKADSNGVGEPTASSFTEFIGLTIAGKKYPINVGTNTSVTIPGLASIVLNESRTAIQDGSVVSQGAGLHVTLLRASNGVAAGAEILLNPTYTLVVPMKDVEGGFALGGGGIGAYAYARVGDEIEAETGKLGGKFVPPLGTDGKPISNTTGKVNLPGLLSVKAIDSTVAGTSIPALSETTVSSKLADLKLFPTALGGGLITATAIGSTSHVRLDDEERVTEGELQFINLRIAGKAIPINVPPNTTLNIAGLGKVVINEHKELRAPGVAHAYQVIALHITLDTARAGLPVGAEIIVGASQAYVYG